MLSSPLQRALVLGLARGGDLHQQLGSLGRYTVRSEQDAMAIIDALRKFPTRTDDLGALQAVVHLFCRVGPKHCAAAKILRERGVPELIRVFDELIRDPTAEGVDTAVLIILKSLSRYGTRACVERVVEAARMETGQNEYLWYVILTKFYARPRQRDFIFDSLSRKLPRDCVALPLLDVANVLARAGGLQHHPFDSKQGQKRLRDWLTSRYVERVRYARFAAMALPFMHGTERDNLLGLARGHADIRVRIKAAWASAHVGQEIGVMMLRTYSRDPICFQEASEYLISLDRPDALQGVGEEVDSDFSAMAKFAASFAEDDYYRESLPDELAILDRRKLFWPPAGHELPLWLIQYVVYDPYGLEAAEMGCGVVSGTVDHYPLFNCHQLPPDDCYAIHCFAESNIEEINVFDQLDYAQLLQQWPQKPLEEAEVVRVVDIPARWNYGRRLVALAEAKINGQVGWAVLDGPHSAWYPACEMPEDQHELAVLMIHVGRRMLGLSNQTDRNPYLVKSAPQEASSCQVLEVYEELLEEFTEGDIDLKCMLIADGDSALARHMQIYAAAREQLGFETKESALIRVFHLFLEVASELRSGAVEAALFSRGPLVLNFDAYVDAMLSLGRQGELAATVQRLEPYWTSCVGCAELGAAAHKAGDVCLAERILLMLCDPPDFLFSRGMTLLIKLWHQQGKWDDARNLLIHCMQKLVEHATERFVFDREMCEEPYQEYRAQFMDLFADSGKLLEQLGLPASVLTKLDSPD